MIIQIDRAKKKVSIKSEPKKSTSGKSYVVIDYPQNGDKIQTHYYGVRIGASAGHRVEFSIVGGAWHPTRINSGYFWYDWHNIPAGPHKCVARITLLDGKINAEQHLSCAVRCVEILRCKYRAHAATPK